MVPIDYGFRPRLRGRLTLRRLALRRNPWTFGGSVSRTPVVTHVSIRTSDTSTTHYQIASTAYGTLRYRVYKVHTLSFGACLEPRYIFAARPLN